MDLYDAASYHSLVLRTENKSPRTSQQYLSYEKRFLAYLEAKDIPADLDALNAVNVRQSILWLQKQRRGRRGGAVRTHQYVRVLKIWDTFLWREKVRPVRELEHVQPPHVDSIEVSIYSQTEVLALMAAADQSRLPDRDRLLIRLLLKTGIRASEATGLTTDRVHPERGQRSITVLGKGGRERTVPLPDDVIRLLRAYERERAAFFERFPDRRTDRVFLTHQGLPLTTRGLEAVVRRLGAVARVPNAHPHRWRHTFATAYLTIHKGDETGLREILGHVSSRIMSRYIHLSKEAVRERVAQSDPISTWLKAAR